MAIPNYSQSLITAVGRTLQDLPRAEFVVGGIGGVDSNEFTLFRRGQGDHVFNLWRSPVYQIGKKFDIIEIRLSVYPDIDTDYSIIPVLYFDNESVSVEGTTIDITNYPNGGNYFVLRSSNFSSVRGETDFFLEIQFTGANLTTVMLPIEIELEVYEQ